MDKNVSMPRLEDVLRHPDDLQKISALKAEYARKKAAVDSQLREGLRDQLEMVTRNISALADSQRHVAVTREDLTTIDRLCADSQDTVGDFAQINRLARIQRNFDTTLAMRRGLDDFAPAVREVLELLAVDDEDLETQPNLLPAHMALSKLRDLRDDAMDQISRAQDRSAEAALAELFAPLDEAIDMFDDHLGAACINLISLVQADQRSLVVRLAIVIASEEKNDERVRALQEAQKDHQALASRFKSMNIGPKSTRGYKEKFIQSIELRARAQFDQSKEAFLDDPERLEKSLRWFFQDLFVVQQGMQSLMPKKWKIYSVYTDIYHRLMHDFLIGFVNDPDMPAANMLAIINWSDKYYKKMAKLGWSPADLTPNVLDDREPELVRDWRNLIVRALDDWVERLADGDRKRFLERDMDSIDTNVDGLFCTKTLSDMWKMLYEQICAAAASQRTDVVEGVVDAMFRAIKSRQAGWQALVESECAAYKAADRTDGLQQLQDWLIAIANDQILCIDDNAETGALGHVSRFRRDFEQHVSPGYLTGTAAAELDVLRDGYVDLGTFCLGAFIDLIFAVDFRAVLPDFFTPKWYGEFAMKRIISTFEDYLSDYGQVLHPSLVDIFVEEISDALLIRYLSAVRNRGARFRRQDPFTDKFKDDVLTAFAFFRTYPDSFAATIKDRWRLVDWLVRLLEAERAAVVGVFSAFKVEYWDLQLSWVEAVLRARDDFERSMVSAVKRQAAEMSVERGLETIMSKVR